MDAPSKLSDLLPSVQAKWSAFLSITLSGLLYALLPWLLSDTPIAPALAQKLSLLLLAAIPLLLGAFVILFFVVRAYHVQTAKHTDELAAEREKNNSKINLANSQRFNKKINYPPNGIV